MASGKGGASLGDGTDGTSPLLQQDHDFTDADGEDLDQKMPAKRKAAPRTKQQHSPLDEAPLLYGPGTTTVQEGDRFDPLPRAPPSWLDDEVFGNGEEEDDDDDEDRSSLAGRVRALWMDVSRRSGDLVRTLRYRWVIRQQRAASLSPVVVGNADLASRWSDMTLEYRWVLLALTVLILWPLGLYSLPRFTNSTDSTFHPVSGTPSYEAVEVYRKAFVTSDSDEVALGDPMNPPMMVLLRLSPQVGPNVTLTDPQSPLYNATHAFCTGYAGYLKDNVTPDDLDPATEPIEIQVLSFYSLKDEHLATLAPALVADGGRSTVLQISYNIPATINVHPKARHAFVHNLLDAVQVYGDMNVPDGVLIGYTSIKHFQRDLLAGVNADKRRLDGIVLPLALVILCIVLGCNIRVLLFPLISMLSTVCLWSIVMYPIATAVQITQFTPSIMMSLTLGLGIDYTLFLLSRVLEEARKGNGTPGETHWQEEARFRLAIEAMLRHAGHIIIVSGLTLMVTFLGLVLLPLQIIQSIGLGASISILSCMLTNLTLVPAMLHTPYGTHLLRSAGGGGCGVWIANLSCLGRIQEWWAKRRSASNTTSEEAEGGGGDEAGGGYVSFEDMTENDEAEETAPQENGVVTENGDSVKPAHLNGATNHHDTTTTTRPGGEDLASAPGESTTVARKSVWYRLAMRLLDPKQSWIILGSILVAAAPICAFSGSVKNSISFDLLLPAGSPSLLTYHDLGDTFGRGSLSPFKVIFDGHASEERIDTDHAFHVMQTVVKELRQLEGGGAGTATLSLPHASMHDVAALVHQHGINPMVHGPNDIDWSVFEHLDDNSLGPKTRDDTVTTSFTGIATINNVTVPRVVYLLAEVCAQVKPYCPVELLHALDELDRRVTSADRMTTYVTAIYGGNPFDSDGIRWLTQARKTLDRLEAEGITGSFRVVLDGNSGVAYDAVQKVYRAFPFMILMTLVVVFCLVGFFFNSVVAPLRSIFSICLTLGIVFGLLVLTYQHGLLNGTLLHQTGEVSWIAPLMAFSIIVGLGLDYDVFLISRILEFRLAGYTHESSIVAGLQETGGIITAAGIIMGVSFGGMLWSASPALNQWSFLLTVAVLLDTFVIRTMVVPILTHKFAKWSWWPRVLPIERIDLLASSSSSRATTTMTTTGAP